MKEKTANRARLGAFVLVAITFLFIGLYYIGSNKNIFHSTINVNANFKNVGGLMPGNNVRYNGIDVGIVSKVYSISDTSIKVEFTIDEVQTKYITQTTIVSIGTDGLLGSKLINLSPGKLGAPSVQEGNTLNVLNPLEMNNALRTLTLTNTNLKEITDDIKGVTKKFNTNNSLWHLLTDTVLADNVRSAVVKFKLTGDNTEVITDDMSKMIKDIKSGKGSIGAILKDTTFSHSLKQTLFNLHSISDSVSIISSNFITISENLKNGKGSIGGLLKDTTIVLDLQESMKSIRSGAAGFNENMEALKHSWPFKKYFRNQQNIPIKK